MPRTPLSEPIYATCLECKERFQLYRPWQRFCSARHRDRFKARRMRQQAKAFRAAEQANAMADPSSEETQG